MNVLRKVFAAQGRGMVATKPKYAQVANATPEAHYGWMKAVIPYLGKRMLDHGLVNCSDRHTRHFLCSFVVQYSQAPLFSWWTVFLAIYRARRASNHRLLRYSVSPPSSQHFQPSILLGREVDICIVLVGISCRAAAWIHGMTPEGLFGLSCCAIETDLTF
jgi:hypothetical protein